MEKLKYTVIKSRKQYNKYCKILEGLAFSEETSIDEQNEIELLTMLIEVYDQANRRLPELGPIELLKSLMAEHNLKAKDLIKILGVSKGMVSGILGFKKGLSKDSIRILANYFGVSQEAFNRPYELKLSVNRKFKYAKVMNTPKVIDENAPSKPVVDLAAG